MTEPPAKYGRKDVTPTTPLSTAPVEAPYNVQLDRDAVVQRLKDYHELAKRLMAVADKAQIEEAARVLAIHVGHYQRQYGQAPMEETLAALHADNPTDEQLADAAEGMRCLISVLMLATGVADESGGTA